MGLAKTQALTSFPQNNVFAITAIKAIAIFLQIFIKVFIG